MTIRAFLTATLLCALTAAGCAAAHAQDETEAKTITIGFADPGDALTQAKMLLSPKGAAVFNRNNNTIVVVDYPKNIAAIEKMFRDQPSPQNVRIEVRFKDSSSGSGDLLGFNVTNSSHSERGVQHITTISGGTAYIEVGEAVAEPYWFYEYGLTYGYVSQGVVWRDVGARLMVQPRVSGNMVQVTVVPEISFFDGNHRRSVQYRNASTTVVAADGQSVEIGGAAQSGNRQVDEFTINFFRTKEKSRFSLILTPHILGSPAQGKKRPPAAYIE